jgi:hypothetical protein
MDYRDSIKEWLDERAPLTTETNDIRYVDLKTSAKRTKSIINGWTEKARISVAWRRGLSRRLGLCDDEIVRATNTIIEMIEQALTQGETVRLSQFGDFKLIDGSEGEKKWVRFIPNKDWLSSINEPQIIEDIGLFNRYQKGRLTRRI